jgi:hypothetical protein
MADTTSTYTDENQFVWPVAWPRPPTGFNDVQPVSKAGESSEIRSESIIESVVSKTPESETGRWPLRQDSEEHKPIPFGRPVEREILLDPFGLPLSPQPLPYSRDPLNWSKKKKFWILIQIALQAFLAQFLSNCIVSWSWRLSVCDLTRFSLRYYGLSTRSSKSASIKYLTRLVPTFSYLALDHSFLIL